MFYSRPQLKLLLLLAVTLCAGLGVREWRAGFPDLAQRLEHFDRDHALAAAVFGTTAGRADVPGAGERTATAAEMAGTPSRDRPASESALPAQTEAVGAGPSGATPAPTPLTARASPVPPPVEPRPVDINRAAAGELARLPGVGPGMAARIIAERERRGRFDSPDALRAVLGMGPKKLAAIRELITVSE
jgi:competence protein ComEA